MALVTLHNEAELLRKIAAGDQRAFAELFNGYYNQVANFVSSLTNSVEMTEEIVLDVFTKIWNNRKSLMKVNKFNSYLFILTRNHTLTCIRSHMFKHRMQLEYDKLVCAETKDVFIEEDELDYFSLINQAVSLLPPQQQRVFLLRQQGLKNSEIAQKMNISSDSVKKYQQLAMKFVSHHVKSTMPFVLMLLIKTV